MFGDKMMHRILHDIKKPLIFLTILFVLSLWLGYYSSALHPKEAGKLFESLVKDISLLKHMSPFAIFLLIFLNNAAKSFAVMLLGTLFGIVPILFIFVNGLLIGIVSFVIIAKEGVRFLVLGTVPHGVFEIPAVLISAAYGMRLGKRYWRKLKYGEPFKPALWSTLKSTVKVIVPILLVASFIETFITGYLLTSL